MGKLREAAEKYIGWHDGDNAEELLKVVDEVENSMRWIPVAEKLPPDPENGTDTDYLPEYIVMIIGAQLPTMLKYEGDRKWWDAATDEYYPVVAWRPMPEPYRTEIIYKAGKDAGADGLMPAT